ncbi:MAG: glycosyl hydrolase [Dehalococcoidia bacterium]
MKLEANTSLSVRFAVAITSAACAVVACALPAAAGGAEQSRAKKRQSAPAPLYWGAQIGPQMTGEAAPWDMRAVHQFARLARKRPSLISFSAPFADCRRGPCSFYSFPTTPLNNVRAYGAIPIFNWSYEGQRGRVDDPQFRLSRLISGAYDGYIRRFAQSARDWGHPFFLRFNWEMNGFWFPWSPGVNRNSPRQFTRAWRHVHGIFSAAGATNVSWVWCPNVDFTRKLVPLERLYPGHAFVDWTCLDGFNWGDTPNSGGWMSFDRIYRSTYRRVVRIAPRKPMLIGEVASDNRGGSKATWIRNMLRIVPARYRKIRGLVWYDQPDQGMNWTLERDRKARKAFARGIRRKVYRPNVFSELPPGRILPPGRHLAQGSRLG